MPSVDITLTLATNNGGDILLETIFPSSVTSGLEIHVHDWLLDPAGRFGASASNAVSQTVP